MEEIDRAFSVCGYCFRPIGEEESGFISSGQIESGEGFGPDEFEGQAVEVRRGDGHIIAVVLDPDSEAAEDGSNLMYFVCSPECGAALDAFLNVAAPVELRPMSDEHAAPSA